MRGTQRGVLIAALMLVAVACSGGEGGDGGDGGDEDPITIGISLPLTGERSQPGIASGNGYEIWADMVNESGGILGRPVELVVKDDASDPNRTRSNYQSLIDQEDVDLVLGTFSSLLNETAAAVAEQREMLFICPSCGNPGLFERGFKYFFFAQPAVSDRQADLFAEWVTSLPEGERPTTAAYPTIDDPFAIPVIEAVRTKLEAAGIKTVSQPEPYPQDLADFTPLANELAASGAEMIIQGAVFNDAVSLIRAMQQVNYNPEILFQTSAPSHGDQYAEAIGQANTEGVFYAVSWSPAADFPQNHEFVERYTEKFDDDPSEDSANSFGSGQVLKAAVEAVGNTEDQAAMADWLHENTVETVMGPISWDDAGRPQEAFILAQWQDGESKVVLPEEVAQSDQIVFPKPAWGSAG